MGRIHILNSYFTINEIEDMWYPITELKHIMDYRWDTFITKHLLSAYYMPSNVPSAGKSTLLELPFVGEKTDNKAITNKCIICEGWKVLWRQLRRVWRQKMMKEATSYGMVRMSFLTGWHLNRLDWSEGGSWDNSLLGRRISKCKSPEAWLCLSVWGVSH